MDGGEDYVVERKKPGGHPSQHCAFVIENLAVAEADFENSLLEKGMEDVGHERKIRLQNYAQWESMVHLE